MIKEKMVGRLDSAALKSLTEKVLADQKTLQQFFQDSLFEKMGEIIGEKAIFVSPEGRTIKGPKVIGHYFAALKDGGVREVEFEPANVYVSEIRGPEHNYVAYIIWRFFYMSPEGADPAGSWARVSLHRFNCTWENP